MAKKKTTRTSSKIRKAKRIVEAYELAQVLLLKSQTERGKMRDDEMPDTAEISVTVNASVAKENQAIHVRPTMTIASRYSETEDQPFVEITAEFLLIYVIQSPLKLSAEDLKAFSESTSVFNVWPYFREFVQSTTSRMGLPPLTMPLFSLRNLDGIGADAQPRPKRRKKAAKK